MIKNMKVSTLVTIVLVVAALLFAVLGFSSALNSYVAPAVIAIYMMISSAAFGILAVRGLRREEVVQRILGVAAVTAALYMVAMAVVYFVTLNSMEPLPYY